MAFWQSSRPLLAAAVVVVVAALSSSVVVATTNSPPRSYVGIDPSNPLNLLINPPENGAVIVHGVDCGAEVTHLKQQVASLQQEVVALRAEKKQDVNLLQEAMCNAGIQDRLSVTQSIATRNLFEWAAFEIDGQHFLVDGGYNDGSTFNIDSTVRRWNAATGQFEDYQTLTATFSTVGVRHFEVEGNHYIVTASHAGSGSGGLLMFEWNALQQKFDNLPSTSLAWPWALRTFKVGNVQFVKAFSALYQFNPTTKALFRNPANDNLPAGGHVFNVDNATYMVLEGVNNVQASLYQWDIAALTYSQVQQNLGFFGKYDTGGKLVSPWTDFVDETDNTLYLVAGNNFDANKAEVVVLKWRRDTKQLEEHQRVVKDGHTADVEHFFANGRHYVVATSGSIFESGSTYANDFKTIIYAWDTQAKALKKIEEVDTKNPFDVEHFAIEGTDYIAVGFNRDNVSGGRAPTSFVYEWNKLCY